MIDKTDLAVQLVTDESGQLVLPTWLCYGSSKPSPFHSSPTPRSPTKNRSGRTTLKVKHFVGKEPRHLEHRTTGAVRICHANLEHDDEAVVRKTRAGLKKGRFLEEVEDALPAHG